MQCFGKCICCGMLMIWTFRVSCSWFILKRLKDQGYTFQTVSSSETSNLKDATLGLHPLPPLQLCCRWVGSLWGHYPWPSFTLFPFFPGDRLLFRLPTLLSIWSAVSDGLWTSMIKLPVFYLLSACLPLAGLPRPQTSFVSLSFFWLLVCFHLPIL